jgi:hypothetical protein
MGDVLRRDALEVSTTEGKRKRKGVKPKVIRLSTDPDADWYHRGERKGRDGETESSFSVWGYEATLVVSGADDPSDPQPTPSLVMGMAPLHKPATQVGKNATVALSSIHDRGHPARLTPSRLPERLVRNVADRIDEWLVSGSARGWATDKTHLSRGNGRAPEATSHAIDSDFPHCCHRN